MTRGIFQRPTATAADKPIQLVTVNGVPRPAFRAGISAPMGGSVAPNLIPFPLTIPPVSVGPVCGPSSAADGPQPRQIDFAKWGRVFRAGPNGCQDCGRTPDEIKDCRDRWCNFKEPEDA